MTLTGWIVAEPEVRDTYANLRQRAKTWVVDDGTPGIVGVHLDRQPEAARDKVKGGNLARLLWVTQ